ncbi:aldehyde dehydrogenase family protein [Peribacillus simplex]|uniref:aldehyde dehydrogenase family protein n=1 Tax=Peribacillus simplex TaxID=1478 RepID=UPI0010BEF8B4|nr:aldehyde dehydrogenase family protein [Peribacillus simplex]TKH03449.1 aldehyde dehydrogenase family protein [Peribacillus simplex]
MNTYQNDVINYGIFINGEWKETAETTKVLNKYSGNVIAHIGNATKEDVYDAITSALEAFKTKKVGAFERYEILLRAADTVRERKEVLAALLVKEAGKVWKDAYAEVDRGIQTLIASAEEAKRISGEGVPLGQPGNENKMAFTIRVPVGVIGAISPFNFPLNLVLHKIGPALAAGNAVVLKPANATPIIACELANILTEAGLPSGFFNVVNGSGAKTGEYLLEDERIAMFTFTGSPGIGRHIKSKTGIRKVTLELGNNSPNIVHHDAPDLEKAAELCVTHGFSNAGQACISVQRVYVHEDIYDQFVEKAIKVAETLKVGNPEDPQTDIGPMISLKEAERAETWIKEAVVQGANIAYGGKRTESVLQPTILVNVKPDMKVICQEVFAPIISIISFSNIDEAFAQANDSQFGLQAGLFTSNLQLALRAVHELEFGGVIINGVSTYRADVMPYGGVKDSGIGKEGPHYTVQEMTDERLVVLNLND